jgi:hypothetical protein
MAKGLIDLGKGIYDAEKGAHDAKQAKEANSDLIKYGIDKTRKNSRFLHQAELNARQNRANGILGAVTGAMDVASGVFSLVPGFGSTVSTAVSLASKAASMIGKFIISKVFNSKKKEQAWADILKFSSVEGYNRFENRIGTDNFRRVLRRKTGVSTREHFSKALNVMDAIDIYTTAKLHSGDQNSKNPDDNIAKATLSGIGYSDPKAYKEIKLKDILSHVGESGNWKSTLKESISDVSSVFTGKTREEKEDIY